MKIICISGKAQHGKDTAASILKEELEADGYSVLVTHYADLLKYICKTFFDWNGEKDEYGRRLLQYVGTDVIRAKEPDYWVKFTAGILELFADNWDYAIIPDCRFPNELDYLRERGFDVTHLRVVRTGFESQLTPEQLAHPSETALDHCAPDHFIMNGGSLEDLRRAVTSWIMDVNGHHQESMFHTQE